MPRNNLSKATPYLKKFCKEVNIPYQCDDYFVCLKKVYCELKEVARQIPFPKVGG